MPYGYTGEPGVDEALDTGAPLVLSNNLTVASHDGDTDNSLRVGGDGESHDGGRPGQTAIFTLGVGEVPGHVGLYQDVEAIGDVSVQKVLTANTLHVTNAIQNNGDGCSCCGQNLIEGPLTLESDFTVQDGVVDFTEVACLRLPCCLVLPECVVIPCSVNLPEGLCLPSGVVLPEDAVIPPSLLQGVSSAMALTADWSVEEYGTTYEGTVTAAFNLCVAHFAVGTQQEGYFEPVPVVALMTSTTHNFPYPQVGGPIHDNSLDLAAFGHIRLKADQGTVLSTDSYEDAKRNVQFLNEVSVPCAGYILIGSETVEFSGFCWVGFDVQEVQFEHDVAVDGHLTLPFGGLTADAEHLGRIAYCTCNHTLQVVVDMGGGCYVIKNLCTN